MVLSHHFKSQILLPLLQLLFLHISIHRGIVRVDGAFPPVVVRPHLFYDIPGKSSGWRLHASASHLLMRGEVWDVYELKFQTAPCGTVVVGDADTDAGTGGAYADVNFNNVTFVDSGSALDDMRLPDPSYNVSKAFDDNQQTKWSGRRFPMTSDMWIGYYGGAAVEIKCITILHDVKNYMPQMMVQATNDTTEPIEWTDLYEIHLVGTMRNEIDLNITCDSFDLKDDESVDCIIYNEGDMYKPTYGHVEKKKDADITGMFICLATGGAVIIGVIFLVVLIRRNKSKIRICGRGSRRDTDISYGVASEAFPIQVNPDDVKIINDNDVDFSMDYPTPTANAAALTSIPTAIPVNNLG